MSRTNEQACPQIAVLEKVLPFFILYSSLRSNFGSIYARSECFGGEDRVVRVNLLVGVVKFPPEGSFLYR